MIFIAVTNQKISHHFSKDNLVEMNCRDRFVTVVTDDFLSYRQVGKKGIKAMETPLGRFEESEEVFTSFEFQNEPSRLVISKNIGSGRPVYYYVNGQGEFYCSSHISMLRRAGVPIAENKNIVPEYIIFNAIMAPETFYKDIKQLLIGSRITVDFGRSRRVKINNEIFPFKCESSGNPEEVIQKTLAELERTISNYSSASDRLSMVLSGGLDSSILCKIMNKKYGISNSYSTGYPFEFEEKNQEKEYALTAANALGLDHHYYQVSNEDYLTSLIDSISAIEEPVAGLQPVLFFDFFKNGLAPKSIIISGDGADSSFGSNSVWLLSDMMASLNTYKNQIGDRYRFLKVIEAAASLAGKQGQRFFLNTLLVLCSLTGKGDHLKVPIQAINKMSFPLGNPKNILWEIEREGNMEWVCRYFKVKKEDVIRNRYGNLKPFEGRPLFDILSISAILGSAAPHQSIWSKVAEHHQKIIIYPFLHRKHLDNIFRVSWPEKLKEPKRILREVARRLEIPENIVSRPKIGLGVSHQEWSAKGGLLEPMVRIAGKAFDIHEICSMQNGNEACAKTYWCLINYGIWKRLCIDLEPVESLKGELKEIQSSLQS